MIRPYDTYAIRVPQCSGGEFFISKNLLVLCFDLKKEKKCSIHFVHSLMNLMPWKKATRSVVVIAPRGAAQLQSDVALEKMFNFWELNDITYN